MIKASVLYVVAGLIRFIFVIYITLKTVDLLNIEEYALLGIANVFAMFIVLIWFLYIDSSFQKLYSLKRIVKTVNFVVLLSFIILSANLVFVLNILFLILDTFKPNVRFMDVTHVNSLWFYCTAISLNSFVISLLNAKRKKPEYFLQMTLPSVLVAIYLFNVSFADLNNILMLNAVCIATTTIVGVLNSSIIFKKNYSTKKSIIVFSYMVNYVKRSILYL